MNYNNFAIIPFTFVHMITHIEVRRWETHGMGLFLCGQRYNVGNRNGMMYRERLLDS